MPVRLLLNSIQFHHNKTSIKLILAKKKTHPTFVQEDELLNSIQSLKETVNR